QAVQVLFEFHGGADVDQPRGSGHELDLAPGVEVTGRGPGGEVDLDSGLRVPGDGGELDAVLPGLRIGAGETGDLLLAAADDLLQHAGGSGATHDPGLVGGRGVVGAGVRAGAEADGGRAALGLEPDPVLALGE